jgi:D-alanyl-D-alanine carboxypeptidase/D-alanyl-D-alanine-endopeptidase (penicillin-binding protein 4)
MNEITLVVQLWAALTATVPALGPLPLQPVNDAAAETLRGDLERILRQGRLGSHAGILIVSLDRSDTLFAHHADSALVPASNLKLFTSVAALHYLGPGFRYNTYLVVTGPVTNGVLEGDVVLYGTGDPTLSDRFGARVLEAFADSLKALGVVEVRGDVIGDASYFSGRGIGIGWQTNYSNAIYAAPASALSFTENVASIEVRPGAAGAQPTLRVVPGGDGIDLVNRATTVSSGRTRLNFGRTGYDSPLTVSGRITQRSGSLRYLVPVSDPAHYAAGALRETLASRGVSVHGVTRSVHTPEASVLSGRSLFAPALAGRAPVRIVAIHTSPRLLDVLEVVNKRSNNFMAEQVLRTVGRVALGDGSVEGGTAALTTFGRDVVQMDSLHFRVFDGSGLSPLNRTTPRAVVDLLAFAAKSPLWEPFWQTLPQTGAPDGLRRMLGTPAEGRVWAKTGTISSVSALSGYVRTADGEMLMFSILNNRATSASRAKRLEDQIVARLARFDRTEGAVGQAGAAATAPGIR